MIFSLRKRGKTWVDWSADLCGSGARLLIVMRRNRVEITLSDGGSGVQARFAGEPAAALERAAEFIERKTGVKVSIIAPVEDK